MVSNTTVRWATFWGIAQKPRNSFENYRKFRVLTLVLLGLQALLELQKKNRKKNIRIYNQKRQLFFDLGSNPRVGTTKVSLGLFWGLNCDFLVMDTQ